MLSPTPLGGPPYGPMLSIAMYLAPLTTGLAVPLPSPFCVTPWQD